MRATITARRAFDYQMATGAAVLVLCVVALIPPLGRPENLGLSLTGAGFTLLVLALPASVRLRFSERGVEYVTLLWRVSGRWPLDGTSLVSVERVTTPSRWGRAVPQCLVLTGMDGTALAVPRGRFTKEAQWSEFLLDAQQQGRVMATDEATTALMSLHDGGGAEGRP